ncbi:DsbA family oxidoreductase [Cupriavidus sp. D39]|uniref:DsbA family oxidoreductase n=1 Tax=Cupriavidus sp. D39 TaxID=2997877 RepID=UPI00226EFBE1|nr:DsbA family oxidoreductase [Cupriavidus sp. D39]MCY0852580.1 DsbA family oxidoreductase [Cupriavidus sp. D39]
MEPVDIQVTYDFICPWCWIGHRNLKTAAQRLTSEVAPNITYAPYELNPDMPATGVDRKEYRSAKFGSWARSRAMDVEVAIAGKRVGLDFNYDVVAITPNTRLAHRLMAFAQGSGEVQQSEALFEAIFSAYFSRGEDIGSIDVLVSLAASVGFDAHAARDFLSGKRGEAEVVAEEMRAHMNGIRSVPTIRIGSTDLSGAQPASVLERALEAVTVSADKLEN